LYHSSYFSTRYTLSVQNMKLYSKIVILSITLLCLSGAFTYYFTITKVEEVLISNGLSTSSLGEIISRTMLVSSIVLTVAIALSVIISKQIIKPFIELTKAAQEFGRGNTQVTINTQGNDEISILGRELKKSSVSLNKRILEQQVLYKKLEAQKNKILQQKQRMEHSNYQIKESISYAKRIQRSLLPDVSILKKNLKDGMVLYLPKDIVSGDFYWFERVRKGRNDYLVIACADSTGHGVPGAIMSIMGSNQLTNIIYYQNYLDPQKILARLDKNIKIELYREEQDESKKEGMEIGICVIDLDEFKLEYAGVGIPLYFIRDKKLETFKPLRDMAGGIEGEEREVEGKIPKYSIELQKGDRIYMSSDGFQDQFGGEDDKKFMAKRLKTLLEEISDQPMNRQTKTIGERFMTWKGKSPQTDDVVVIGAAF
jgi:serine phosphatase RsbU (regulator of sigma subunit)